MLTRLQQINNSAQSIVLQSRAHDRTTWPCTTAVIVKPPPCIQGLRHSNNTRGWGWSAWIRQTSGEGTTEISLQFGWPCHPPPPTLVMSGTRIDQHIVCGLTRVLWLAVQWVRALHYDDHLQGNVNTASSANIKALQHLFNSSSFVFVSPRKSATKALISFDQSWLETEKEATQQEQLLLLLPHSSRHSCHLSFLFSWCQCLLLTYWFPVTFRYYVPRQPVSQSGKESSGTKLLLFGDTMERWAQGRQINTIKRSMCWLL